MKKEDGITMGVLAFAIVILLILAGVALSYVVGDRGGLAIASEESFRSDMQQIKEKVDLKQTEYDLNEERYSSVFTKNIEAQILEAYVGKMEIKASYVKNQKRLILTVFYKPEEFTERQRQIMREQGFVSIEDSEDPALTSNPTGEVPTTSTEP